MNSSLHFDIFGHFQRTSVAANMTVKEFIKSRNASDGRVVLLVFEHKTSAQGPAQLALEANHHKLFSQEVNFCHLSLNSCNINKQMQMSKQASKEESK